MQVNQTRRDGRHDGHALLRSQRFTISKAADIAAETDIEAHPQAWLEIDQYACFFRGK